jgi:hypothetical protein
MNTNMNLKPRFLNMTGEYDLTNFMFDGLGLLIIIFSCFFIYFKTKKLETLSSHKGIEYFRKAFFFFGLSFLIRLIGHFFRYLQITNFDFKFFMDLQILLNFIASAYILYSLFWKKFNKEWLIYVGSIIILSLLKLAPKNKWFFISVLPIFVFAFMFFLGKKYMKTKNKISRQILIIYMFLVSSWIISGFGMFFTRIFDIERFYISYFLAIVFIMILYRVIEITKVK